MDGLYNEGMALQMRLLKGSRRKTETEAQQFNKLMLTTSMNAIPEFSQKLVTGTSRTKYVKPALVKSTIHSYRGG